MLDIFCLPLQIFFSFFLIFAHADFLPVACTLLCVPRRLLCAPLLSSGFWRLEGCFLSASLPSRSLLPSWVPLSKAQVLSGNLRVPVGPTYPFRSSLEVDTAAFSSAAHTFVNTPSFNCLWIFQFWVCSFSCWDCQGIYIISTFQIPTHNLCGL